MLPELPAAAWAGRGGASFSEGPSLKTAWEMSGLSVEMLERWANACGSPEGRGAEEEVARGRRGPELRLDRGDRHEGLVARSESNGGGMASAPVGAGSV